MEITKKHVLRIAELARLELHGDKVEKFSQQFTDIIGYMDKMNTIDTSGVLPLYSPSENTSVMREDMEENHYNREELLANAPVRDEHYFSVPRII